MKKLVLLMGIMIASSSAFADICEMVSQDQAEQALSFLQKGAKIEFSHKPMTVNKVNVERCGQVDNSPLFCIQVNDETIDFGYTNIRINKLVSLNIGRLIGCD